MIDEIRKRNKQAMDVDSEEGDIQNPAFWGHRDRDHLLKMVDALAEVVAEWSAFVDNDGEGRDVGHYIKWADAQARGEG
jgi:hypothetical protein